MLRNLLLKTLRDRRRGLVGWSLGLAALAVFTVALYPSVRESAEDLSKLVESLPEGVLALVGGEIDFASGPGFLNSRLFAFLGPLLLLVFAIGFGARTVAGEEQRGTLELVLSTPLHRRRIVAEKLAALLVALSILGGVLYLSLAGTGGSVDLGVPSSRIAGAVVAAVLLAMVFGVLALAVGCAFGRRAVASATAAVAAVVTYLLDAFSTLVESLEPARYASPWFYYDSADVLRGGLEPGNVLVLVGLVLAFSTAAVLSFDRRDVGV
jgi:ABC-2 type transport system permease protein